MPTLTITIHVPDRTNANQTTEKLLRSLDSDPRYQRVIDGSGPEFLNMRYDYEHAFDAGFDVAYTDEDLPLPGLRGGTKQADSVA